MALNWITRDIQKIDSGTTLTLYDALAVANFSVAALRRILEHLDLMPVD